MLAGFRYTSQFRWIGNSPWTSNDVEILLKTRKIPTKPSNPSAPPREYRALALSPRSQESQELQF